MQGLIKFTFLASVFCLNLFSFDFSKISYSEYTGAANYHFFPDLDYSTYRKNDFSQVDAEFFGGKYVKIGDDIYTYNGISNVVFNSEFADDTGFFLEKNNISTKLLFFYDPSSEKHPYPCFFSSDLNKYNGCSNTYSLSTPGVKNVNFTYYSFTTVTKIATCQPGENFNTFTQKCQSCPSGQSWNPQTNSCFKDCTDRNKNIWGFTDGSCADCSGEKDSDGVKKCYCNFIGSSPLLQSVELIEGNFRFTSCQNGSQFWYKVPGTPDSDNNNTKPDNPNPGDKPNPGGDSGGGGGNPGGGIGGGSGGGGNPGGGNPGGGNPGGGGSQDNPKPKPNDPKPDDGQNDGNGKEPKFNSGNFDDSNLVKERSSLYGGIVKHINDGLSKFDGIRDGINQFINNVQLKGFEKVQPSIKGKCPIKKQISLPGGKSQEIVVDYCENLAPVSEISYYAFYAGFAIGGFILMLKLFIFSF